MHSHAEYQRLGGVFIPDLNIFGFIKNEPGLRENTSIVIVQPRDFYQLWYRDTHKPHLGAPPGPFDEWPPEQKRDFVLNFVKGPRQPVPAPYVSYTKDLIDVTPGRLAMQALLDWGASAIPVTVPDRQVITIYEHVGLKTLLPIPGCDYLSATHKVLTGFEERKPIAELYKKEVLQLKDDPAIEQEIKQGVRDYANLIDFQLEIMVVRLLTLQRESNPALAEFVERGMKETRRLLHQQNIIHHWVAKSGDLECLPTWDPQEMVSEKDAVDFLKENTKRYWRHGFASALHSIPNEHPASEPFHPTERKTGHLHVVEDGPKI
jgi:hypothetical protein